MVKARWRQPVDHPFPFKIYMPIIVWIKNGIIVVYMLLTGKGLSKWLWSIWPILFPFIDKINPIYIFFNLI